jgi:uncharacterized protein
VCLGANWGNPGLHMWGAFEAWRRIRSPKLLFIGPPEPVWPWANYQDELLAWYDHHIKGIDNGVAELPPVRYWLMGADRWCEAGDWPPPGTDTIRLHLTSSGGSSAAQHALVDDPPSQAASLSFLALPRGTEAPPAIDHHETQVLSYVGTPMSVDTEVAGSVRLHLTLSSTALDTHIIARLSDLARDGARRTLSYGWLQASYRRVDRELSLEHEVIHDYTHPQALEPGVPVELDIALTPTANLFQAGHQILLEIASRPDILNASMDEGFVYFPYDAPPYACRNTLEHGGQHAWLEVDVRTT